MVSVQLSSAQFCGQRVDRRPSGLHRPLTCSARRRAKPTRVRPTCARAGKRAEAAPSSRLEKGFVRLGDILYSGTRSVAWCLQFTVCLLLPWTLLYVGLGADFVCLVDIMAGKPIPPELTSLSAIPLLAFLVWVFYPEVGDFTRTVPMSPERDGTWFDIAQDKLASFRRELQNGKAEGRSPPDLDDASLLRRFDKDLELRNRSGPDVLQAAKDFLEHLTR